MFWDDEQKRPTPRKALKVAVYHRDKGLCRLCGRQVDPTDYDIGHDKAHSKGGKLTYRNAILLHRVCNNSMRTLSLKQARHAIGMPPTPAENTKRTLKQLSLSKLKFLAKTTKLKVKGSVEYSLFGDDRRAPSKVQYVNALAKVLNENDIDRLLASMPPPSKKRRRKTKGLFDW